jgi:hypothetical protein
MVPLPRQTPPTQQPPPLQALAAQHAWPEPPQTCVPGPIGLVLLPQPTHTNAKTKTATDQRASETRSLRVSMRKFSYFGVRVPHATLASKNLGLPA